MYGGYGGNSSNGNPLIPQDFDINNDAIDSEDEEDIESDDSKDDKSKEVNVSWQAAKTAMSKISSGTSSNIRKAISTYVKAHGGAKNASKSARSGVGTTINIGGFIANVSSQGFVDALESCNIEYENKSIEDILTQLINYLAPAPITKEDSIARKALINTMEQLYEILDAERLNLNDINADTLNFLIPTYIEFYIYERLMSDLGSRIETADIDSKQAVVIENNLKDYINAKVEIAFKGKDFTKIEFTKKEVESLYNQCYTVMEDML